VDRLELDDHQGTPRYRALHLAAPLWDNSDDYYTFVGERAVDLQEKIDITVGQIKAVSTTTKKPPMYISLDEWAPPFRGGHLSTLAIAQFFNAFIRTPTIKMANYTLLTSLLSRDQQPARPTGRRSSMRSSLHRCHGSLRAPCVRHVPRGRLLRRDPVPRCIHRS
jgi:hypothetical protein